MKQSKSFAHQMSVVMPEKNQSLDLETLEELNDPKPILAIKKAREEYRRGEVHDIKELLSKIK